MASPKTLWELLGRAAQQFPEKGVILHDDSTGPPSIITYKQLHYEAKVCSDFHQYFTMLIILHLSRNVVLVFGSRV